MGKAVEGRAFKIMLSGLAWPQKNNQSHTKLNSELPTKPTIKKINSAVRHTTLGGE